MDSEDRTQGDEVLRRAVLAGDEHVWQAWYDETFDDLYAYVLWRSGGRRDRADEISQETWLTAVRSVRRFDPRKGNFLDWMRGIAANVLRHNLREQRRRVDREQAAERCVAVGSGCEDRERQDQIAAALGCLPERQEAVLRAKYLDGLSMAEIAAIWNESPKAIESLLSRARQAFR
ncbi:MAG: sigma-70 family RNA polymerase sigma factor, partial [Thermoguttaceae bacterium]